MSDYTPKIPICGTPTDPAFKTVRKADAPVPSSAPAADQLSARLRVGTACFGGIVFQQENSFHFPEVCFAVKGLDEYAVRRAEQHYASLRHRCPTVSFIPCDRIETVGEYTVFSFAISEHERPLRQILSVNENGLRPMTLLKKLIGFIQDYHSCVTAGGKPYTPLCCLTPDTVYLDLDHRIRVLPLLLFGTVRPAELPTETGTASADVTSDLFSAAFVYVRALSRGQERLAVPDEPIVLQMLAAVPEWRPSLSTVVQALLNGDGAPAEVPFEKRAQPDAAALKDAAIRVWAAVKGPADQLKAKLADKLRRPESGSNTATFYKEE